MIVVRRRVSTRMLACVAILLLLAACGTAATPPISTASTPPVVPPGVSSSRSIEPEPAEQVSPEQTSPEPEPFVARPTLVQHGPRGRKLVALTFDADMTEGMLAELRSGQVRDWINQDVLRELRSTRTPATIFLTGLWAKTYPDEVRAFARDPDIELANHSWDHGSFRSGCYGLPSAATDAQRRAEIVDAADEIERLAGEAPRWFRFPGGCHEKQDLRLVAAEGEQAVGWDVVSGDAFGTDPDAVADAVIDRVEPGSIVVMHLHGAPNAPTTGPALRKIIPALRARGYRFVTLSELLLGPGA